ncbi:MAG: hypothetical protein QM722_01035 [Piscinibacter sp.]
MRRAKPTQVVISALGVREGLLFELLDEETRIIDPLLAAAREFNTTALARAASRRGADRLDRIISCNSPGSSETPEEKRLRHAACLLADIGWRAHPDYRGEQSLNIIAHAAFVGVDHPGRAFLALSIFYRHKGLLDDTDVAAHPRAGSVRMLDRARILGALMRVAYLMSAAMPGVCRGRRSASRAAASC